MSSDGPDEISSTRTWFKPRDGGAAAIEAPLHAIGERLGRYTLRAELGRGGMGVVYQAHDPELGRDVALKVIRAGPADQARLGRFVGEALVTARLQHPAIIPVYEKGVTVAGEVYYTMRLVRGQTLDEVLREHRHEVLAGWSRFKLLQVFVTVCRAIAYAHREGVVHRDLKPGNVIVDEFGGVYVLDWGLASVIAQDPRAAQRFEVPDPEQQVALSKSIVGTPAFMAPEQIRSGSASTALDVFGLGGILYVLLTGREPRVGTQTEALRKILSGEPPPQPAELAPGVPRELERLCMRALAGDPADRPSSAQELADTVQAFLEGRSLEEGRADAEYLRAYRASDHPRPSVAVDLVLLALPDDGPARVFLQRRTRQPFSGAWACPGTFVRMDEALEETAQRLVSDEVCALVRVELEQLHAYGDPGRDPRTRVISVAYMAVLPAPIEAQCAGGWCEVHGREGQAVVLDADGAPVALAFDHQRLVADALARARRR